MKKIYLVGEIDTNGHFTGNLFAYSTLKKAEAAKDYFNKIYNTYKYVIQQLNIN